MAYKLDFHPEAEGELDEAVSWYKEQQDGLEQVFFDDYLALEKRLEDTPQQFPVVFEDVRRANFSKFPFSIFFAIEQVSVFIYAIFHQKRNPKEWEKRL